MTLNEAYESYRSNPTDEAMEVLYPLVREKIKRVIGRMLNEDADEDMLVSVTTDVLMDMQGFKGDSAFSTWVEKAARRDCLDEARRRRGGPEFLDDLPESETNSLFSNENPEMSLMLRETLEQLTTDEKVLLTGKLEGRSGLELAETLRVSRHAIELRWAKLKQNLREILPVSRA